MSRRANIEVLVVDSDARTHVLCQRLFDGPNHHVRMVSDGNSALAAVKDRAPDVLITELHIEGMDGLMLVDRARRENPELGAIVMTGEPSARTAVRALRLGVDDYIIKHADSLSHLAQAIRNGLRRRARTHELERLLVEMTALNEAFLEQMRTLAEANRALVDQLPPPPVPSEPRVLVVDDETTIVALLETLLRSQGYVVVGADGATAARAILAEQQFDLILTDQELGDGSGLELAAHAQRLHPNTAILVMTGFATVDAAVDAVNLGLAGYLRKPFDDLSVVVARVDAVLADARRERAERRYLHGVQAQNAEFVARYRLLKTKLETLQRERS